MPEDTEIHVDEGRPRRVDVELFIVHPTITPAEITSALGLEGIYTQCVGDQRKTPKGTVLQGKYRETRWRHSIEYELREQWFADKVALLVDSLVPHREFLHHLRATGGRLSIIVQFFADGYLGDDVTSDTLAKMTDLQLDFGIECFAIPQSD